MDLTTSYSECFNDEILSRYEFAETRNAAVILKATNPQAFENLCDVLSEFTLTSHDLITPGGQESNLASRLNESFRSRGWREARVDTLIRLSLALTPRRSDGESRIEPVITETLNTGYKVDNFRGRVALDVEWNAKDGNLDRDISAYRSLYDSALIDVGVMISRTQVDLRELGRTLGIAEGFTEERARGILGTTTTTNIDKLLPRLTRGDGGGCPILAIFISAQTYEA